MLAETPTWMWTVIAVAGLVLLIWLLVLAKFFSLYIQAMFSRAPVSFAELIGMTLRKVDPRVIVLSRIRAVQGGLDLSTQDLERHYLAGSSVPAVVTLMVAAKQAGAAVTWKQATALDLAGEDLREMARQLRLKQASNSAAVLLPAGDEAIN